ncbi:sensor histidine kinase [Halobellus rufus]|uniref:sensor histidine kinase n=1 Tax=Halobellus rufus TaxID=1448860 RepID=UPI0009DE2E1A|nr:PAS domain-containing sensor histidine kinase [Halobellus rufus]
MSGPTETGKTATSARLDDADVAAQCRAFVDSTTDIFTHIRPSGEMTYVTDTEEMLGRSRQEFLETPLEEFIHPEDKDRAVECFESALAGVSPSTVELRFWHGDGHWMWIESSASPIPSGYNVDGVVTVTRDVTERKRRERELRETQAELEQSNEQLRRQNRRLDRFASVVSHDFRNPLTVARGRLRQARREHDSEALDAIVDPIDRMARMIDELRTLTRTQRRTPKTTPTPIASRAEAAWSVTETGDSELRVVLDREVECDADLGLLDHIFENLFRNAVVHNQRPVTVTVGSLGERPGFYVADDGTGIPTERLDDVLEYGYSTTGQGTGVGLTIVSEFVEAHGWELSITDSGDGGARFAIAFE